MELLNFSNYLIRSITRQPAGPYELVGRVPQTDFYVEGEKVFLLGGSYLLEVPDFNKHCMTRNPKFGLRDGFTVDPVRKVRFKEDCENGLHVIEGRYVNWNTDWNGNYDLNYSTSASLEGPWGPDLCILPHGGNGKLFEDADGELWYAYFNNSNDAGTRAANHVRMNIYPLAVTSVDGELIIEPKALPPNRARLDKLGALWQTPR